MNYILVSRKKHIYTTRFVPPVIIKQNIRGVDTLLFKNVTLLGVMIMYSVKIKTL